MFIKQQLKKLLYISNKHPLSKLLYEKEIKKRSSLPITNIKALSRYINMFAPYTNELHPPNDWYGHAKNFKNFLGLPQKYQFKFIIEHGTCITDETVKIDLETNLPSFITYSKRRASVFKQYKDYVYSIGPFIHYAPDLLTSEEFSQEKKRLRKNLLFFPMHSTLDTNCNFDIIDLCKTIKKIGKNFNTIRVCLYWIDVLKGLNKIYQDFGFEVITAGHILDPNFLSRLRSIIKLASYTASNGISSHVAYCIFFKKPHYIFPQKLNFSGNSHEIIIKSVYMKSHPYREVRQAFSKPYNNITNRQYALVNKYWGLSESRSKQEFLNIVYETEEIFKSYQK